MINFNSIFVYIIFSICISVILYIGYLLVIKKINSLIDIYIKSFLEFKKDIENIRKSINDINKVIDHVNNVAINNNNKLNTVIKDINNTDFYIKQTVKHIDNNINKCIKKAIKGYLFHRIMTNKQRNKKCQHKAKNS